MNIFYFLNVLLLLGVSIRGMEKGEGQPHEAETVISEKSLSYEDIENISFEDEKDEEESNKEKSELPQKATTITNILVIEKHPVNEDPDCLGQSEELQTITQNCLNEGDTLCVLQLAEQKKSFIEEKPNLARYKEATTGKTSGIISLIQAKEELKLINKNPDLLKDPEWIEALCASYQMEPLEEDFNLKEPQLAEEILELLKENQSLIPLESIETWSKVLLSPFLTSTSFTEQKRMHSYRLAQQTLEFLRLTDCFWDVEFWHPLLLKEFEDLTESLDSISCYSLAVIKEILSLLTLKSKSFLGVKELEWDGILLATYQKAAQKVLNPPETQINNKATYRLKSKPIALFILTFWKVNPICENVQEILVKSWRKLDDIDLLHLLLEISFQKKLTLPEKKWVT